MVLISFVLILGLMIELLICASILLYFACVLILLKSFIRLVIYYLNYYSSTEIIHNGSGEQLPMFASFLHPRKTTSPFHLGFAGYPYPLDRHSTILQFALITSNNGRE